MPRLVDRVRLDLVGDTRVRRTRCQFPEVAGSFTLALRILDEREGHPTGVLRDVAIDFLVVFDAERRRRLPAGRDQRVAIMRPPRHAVDTETFQRQIGDDVHKPALLTRVI